MADAEPTYVKPFAVENSLRACWLKLITKCASGSVDVDVGGAGAGAGTGAEIDKPWPAVFAAIAAKCGIETIPRTRDFLRVAHIAWFLPHVQLRGHVRVCRIERGAARRDRVDAYASAVHRGGALLIGVNTRRLTRAKKVVELNICSPNGTRVCREFWQLHSASHVCVADDGFVFVAVASHRRTPKGVLVLTPAFKFARFIHTSSVESVNGLCADSKHVYLVDEVGKKVVAVDREHGDGRSTVIGIGCLTSPTAVCSASWFGYECVAVFDMSSIKFFRKARGDMIHEIRTGTLRRPTAAVYRAASSQLIVYDAAGFIFIFYGACVSNNCGFICTCVAFNTMRVIPLDRWLPGATASMKATVRHLSVIQGGAYDGAVAFTCHVVEERKRRQMSKFRGHFLCVLT